MHGTSFHCECTNCIKAKKRILSKENNTLREKRIASFVFTHISAFYLVDNVFVILKRHVCERMFKLTEICTLLKKGADPKETILLLNSSVTWCHFRKNGGHIAHPPTPPPPINSILPIPASLDQLPR